MGTCLITEAVHKVSAMHLCHYLLVALAWGSEPSSLGHPPEPSPPSPQPWIWDPSLRARCRQTMRTLVAEVLDFIELFNQVLGTSMAFPAFEMEANRTVGSVDFALPAGVTHPQRSGQRWAQDSQPLLPGMPISQMFSDEDVLSEGESTVYPVFINEAAYYENGMAVIQIEKLPLCACPAGVGPHPHLRALTPTQIHPASALPSEQCVLSHSPESRGPLCHPL
uniref:AstE/AspA barrel-sandwich hybrid domain-containing protein n=1 Tax=Canis lupus familiaris TaxID=9615 RepID=A0A8C0P6X8_CANLF